jgi:putative membrane protein
VQAVTEVLQTGLLFVQSGHDWGGGPPWAGRDGGGFLGPWILVPFLFWIGLLVLVALVVRRLFPGRRRDGGTGAPRDSAEEILRERFARGEVSEGEYLRALGILRGETPANARGTDDRNDAQRH